MADILAVDDEREWLDLYAERLAEMGHTVRTSADGTEATRELQRKTPDLVVLDIRMAPSGRQMLWFIRRYWPEVPVVISSAYVGYRTDPDFAEADAFLEKSTDLTRLVGTIEYVLSKREGSDRRPDARAARPVGQRASPVPHRSALTRGLGRVSASSLGAYARRSRDSEKELHADSLPSRLAEPYVKILGSLCGTEDLRAAAKVVLEEISRATDCEATAMRVHDHRDDYPYFVYHGFGGEFVEQESSLCRRHDDSTIERDEGGLPALECMCGLVLRGWTDARKPFFTEYGSFWTNSTTGLLSGTSDEERGTETRNTCNEMGYESVALVPMRAGDRIAGLIQANSRVPGRFDPTVLEFLERVGRHAGAAVEAAWRREELARLSREHEDRRRGVEMTVAMGEMAATLAHEIKNPLAGMMLSATRLRKAFQGQEKLEGIAEHLCSSIDTLSETVSRIGRSVREPRLKHKEVDVNEVLESAVSLVAPRASEQGVQIVHDESEGLPPVSADARYLMRAFLNLLVNALDVMPSGGVLSLETACSRDGEIRVTVADTGPGIESEDAEALFRPFETKRPGGTGLGLGIVRRIVELHSGTVTLRPRKDGGTEAVVTLPAAARLVLRS